MSRDAEQGDALRRALERCGYNDSLQLAARSVHVQTEVLGGAPLRVRSQVFEGGRLLHSSVVELPPLSDLEAGQEAIRAHHERILVGLRSGDLVLE